MADTKVPDMTGTIVVSDDVFYIVDTSDTTDSDDGSSKKIAFSALSSATETLTNKTIDGDTNTLQDIAYSSIKSTSRSGSDVTVVTGTKGTSGSTGKWNADGDLVDGFAPTGSDAKLVSGTAGTSADLAVWNADGDLVDGPTPPSGTIVGTTDTQTLTNKTLTSPVIAAITNTDHITVTPGTSKLVKTAVLQQDIATDTYKNNSVILTGWTYVTGNGSATRLNDTIAFGITFAAPPILVVSFCGIRTEADAPTSEASFTTTTDDHMNARSYSMGTTGGYLELESDQVFTNGDFYGISWVAIGVLS